MNAVKQAFEGAVGEVAGRDIINHHYSYGRLLTNSERSALGHLVGRLEAEFGEPAWQTWKFVYRVVGVENVESMCIGHRDQARTILELLLERAQHRKACEEQGARLALANERIQDLLAENAMLAAGMTTLGYGRAVRDAEGREADADTRYRSTRANTADAARRRALRAWLVAGAAMIAMLLLGYQTYKLRNVTRLVEARLAVCEFDGKPYGLGSVIDSDSMLLKCATINDGHPQWQRIAVADQIRSK